MFVIDKIIGFKTKEIHLTNRKFCAKMYVVKEISYNKKERHLIFACQMYTLFNSVTPFQKKIRCFRLS